MAQQVKLTIYWKKNVLEPNFANPWVEHNVDEYNVNNETKSLEVFRYHGADITLNLNEMIAFEVEYEK